MSEATIFIKTITGKKISFLLELNETIRDLKIKIHEREGCAVEVQRLVFNGKPLNDDLTLESYNIQQESTLHLVERLLGGNHDAVDCGDHGAGKGIATNGNHGTGASNILR